MGPSVHMLLNAAAWAEMAPRACSGQHHTQELTAHQSGKACSRGAMLSYHSEDTHKKLKGGQCFVMQSYHVRTGMDSVNFWKSKATNRAKNKRNIGQCREKYKFVVRILPGLGSGSILVRKVQAKCPLGLRED